MYNKYTLLLRALFVACFFIYPIHAADLIPDLKEAKANDAETRPPLQIITNSKELKAFVTRSSQEETLFFDTESDEKGNLALIQIATASETVLIRTQHPTYLKPLKRLLSNASIIKVFHAANQDCIKLRHVTGTLPVRVFDTQQAAMLVGKTGKKDGPISFADLVKDLLGETLDKTYQTSDWGQEVLSSEQIEYARNDVEYLQGVYLRLRELLIRKERLEAAFERSAFVTSQIASKSKSSKKETIKLDLDQERSLSTLKTFLERRAKELGVPQQVLATTHVLKEFVVCPLNNNTPAMGYFFDKFWKEARMLLPKPRMIGSSNILPKTEITYALVTKRHLPATIH